MTVPGKEIRVGVAGYCPPSKFDEREARRLIRLFFDQIERANPGCTIVCVSGLSDVGVLSIAYHEATRRGWRTVGLTSKITKSCGQPLFPVDEEIIVGEKWGDESDFFVSYIDMIVRIGVGPQSVREAIACRQAGKRTYEFDLPRTN